MNHKLTVSLIILACDSTVLLVITFTCGWRCIFHIFASLLTRSSFEIYRKYWRKNRNDDVHKRGTTYVNERVVGSVWIWFLESFASCGMRICNTKYCVFFFGIIMCVWMTYKNRNRRKISKNDSNSTLPSMVRLFCGLIFGCATRDSLSIRIGFFLQKYAWFLFYVW